MFSDFLMKSKKTTKKSKKTTKKSSKKKSKKSSDLDDSGIIVIDDGLEVDRVKEMEERKAYLEEARSQDAAE